MTIIIVLCICVRVREPFLAGSIYVGNCNKCFLWSFDVCLSVCLRECVLVAVHVCVCSLVALFRQQSNCKLKTSGSQSKIVKLNYMSVGVYVHLHLSSSC